MQDPDFERTRKFLKTKLAEYLKSRGIDTTRPFRCLNPQHRDEHPSMSFNARTNNVHCFGCDASYDIFDLVGLEYGLSSFSDQYAKVHEMYLGGQPTGLPPSTVITRATAPRPLYKDQDYAPTSRPLTTPATFGQTRIIRSAPGERPAHFAQSTVRSQAVFTVEAPYSPRKADTFFSDNAHALTAYAPINDEGEKGVELPSRGREGSYVKPHALSSLPEEIRARDNVPRSYRDYLRQCARNAGNTTYFKDRGLSDEVIARFHLGFDPAFSVGGDPQSNTVLTWQGAIIPYSDYAYMVRNTDTTSTDRVRKRGQAGILNLETVNQPGLIFITEGEFDALSLETLGYRALSLGGAANLRKLTDYLRDHPLVGRSFCILPDNDEAGRNSAEKLLEALHALHIEARIVSLTAPYKDANALLCASPDTLAFRLKNLERLNTLTFGGPRLPQKSVGDLPDATALLTLSCAPGLYTLSGRKSLLRRTLAHILDTTSRTTLSVMSARDWELTSLCLNRAGQSLNEGQELRELYPKALHVPIPGGEDLASALDLMSLKLNNGDASPVFVVSLCDLDGETLSAAISSLIRYTEELAQTVIVLALPEQSAPLEDAGTVFLKVTGESGDLSFEGLTALGESRHFRLSIREF